MRISGARTGNTRRDRPSLGAPRTGGRDPLDTRRSAVDATTGRKPYTLPIPCDLRAAHVTRTGFHHCNMCHHDRPRWDFYTDRTTGELIAGCRDCRIKRSRQPRERIPSVAELVDGPRRAGRPAIEVPMVTGEHAHALNSLPPAYRQVMVGYYIDGETLLGLSAKLAVSYDTVRMRHRRAMKMLDAGMVAVLRKARGGAAA